MNKLSQRDTRWGNIQLGNSKTYIKDYGCTITCIAMILDTTPDVVNNRMTAVKGWYEGNQVIWASLTEAFPGVQLKRVWTYDNADVKANTPNVLVEVPAQPIGGQGKHWVVYVGGGKLYDPWTGKERPTSDFPNPSGYCVLTKPTPPAPAPTVNPCQEKDDRIGELDMEVAKLQNVVQTLNDALTLAKNTPQTVEVVKEVPQTFTDKYAKFFYSLALKLESKNTG